MTMPNFLIIGAAKAGTTSLYHYLKEHPQIYMSKVKEPRFFAMQGKELEIGEDPVKQRLWSQTITTLEKYQALFEDVTDQKAIGEASPLYLWSESASDNIKTSIPNVKLIACLRHPAERAFSHFLHNIRIGLEKNRQFEKALKDDANLHHTEYIRQGMYFRLLKRYYDRFSPEQIRVYLFEELVASPIEVLKDIYRFLGVDENYTVDLSKKYNESAVSRSLLLEKLTKSKIVPILPRIFQAPLTRILEALNSYKPTLSPKMRQILTEEHFKEDIISLQHLIDRDLSHWLT